MLVLMLAGSKLINQDNLSLRDGRLCLIMLLAIFIKCFEFTAKLEAFWKTSFFVLLL